MKNKVLVIITTMIPANQSFSNALVEKFIEYYKQKNPQDEFIWLNLNKEAMAQISLTVDNFGTYFNENDSQKYIDQLKEVNKIIIAAPMTNFNYPAVLKNYFDHILVANKTFSYKYYKKGESIGLLTHLKVQILTTQGAPLGWYPWGNHTTMIEGIWKFVGAQVCKPIVIAGTKVNYFEKTTQDAIKDYDTQIKQAAENF